MDQQHIKQNLSKQNTSSTRVNVSPLGDLPLTYGEGWVAIGPCGSHLHTCSTRTCRMVNNLNFKSMIRLLKLARKS
jgi:hypothetical protein